ncbi:MAG: WD40 repeat domain-containing protein [Planctomycetales bacterium]|nr:WD40 repeat domain-containing protein [Planctomycetales bacterium]
MVGEQAIDAGLLSRRVLLASTRFAFWVSCLLAIWQPVGDATEPTELPMAHDEYVYMIRFSPDGQTMVTAAGDNVARIWNWSTRQLLHTLAHDAAVYAAEVSPAGGHLATGSGDGNVTLWKLSTGTQVAQQKEHADAVYCVNFSPDGTHLASIGGDGEKGDTKCRIWSVPALTIVRELPGHERPSYGVLFGPPVGPARNTLVTSGGDKLIHIYSLPVGKRKTWTGHTSDVYRCCFSPDGDHLATTSQDGSVRLWNVATGKLVRTLLQVKDPTYDVAYSRDGGLLAAVGDDGFVRIWETRTYTLLTESKTDKEGLYSVVFAPDRTHVITGGVRGVLHSCPVPHVATTDPATQRQVEQDSPDATRR